MLTISRLIVQKRDFPQNLEGMLGVRTDDRQGVQRKAAVLRLIMQQILAALRSCHDTGATSAPSCSLQAATGAAAKPRSGQYVQMTGNVLRCAQLLFKALV
jgi:hypothetical protein